MRGTNKALKEDEEERTYKCPVVLKPWIALYDSIPNMIQIPFTKLSMSFTIISSLILLQVRLLISRFIIPPYLPDIICIDFMSIVHSIFLTPPLLALLLTQPFVPSASMKNAPEWWQKGAHALLEFCTGYMLYDGLYNCVYMTYDSVTKSFQISTEYWCFIGHHLATSFYMTSVRINGAGHLSAMVIMFFGEVTNPIQNSRSILLKMIEMGDCCSSDFMELKLYPMVDFVYALMYFIIRVGLNPYLNIRITYDFLMTKEGRERMAAPLSLSLLFMLWGVTFGTIPWCFESAELLKTHLVNFTAGSQEL